MRLLHLSDIHFHGYGLGWDEDVDQRDELIRDVERLVVGGGTVDGVLVGGDVAFSAQPSQYADAFGWLDRVCAVGGCDPSNVWVVPGNHDVDRSVVNGSAIAKEFRTAARGCDVSAIDQTLHERLSRDAGAEALMEPFRAYNDFASQKNCAVSAQRPSWHDETLSLDGLTLRIVGVNSALVSDAADSSEEENKLLVGTYQCVFRRSPTIVNVVLCHHPPNWLRDWTIVEPYMRRAHVVFFGHEHIYSARQEVDRATLYVCAGAVGPERLGLQPTDEFAPTYNLLSLERDGDQLRVQVEPRVWWHNRTRFDSHPDGVSEFRIAVDLECVDPATVVDSAETVGVSDDELAISANPLAGSVPSETVVVDDDGHDSGRDRLELRRIGVRYMSKPVTRRIDIARMLGVLREDDLKLPPSEMYPGLLRRIREEGMIDELVEELNRG
jgi:3',5'-cyclic AMP phosphodiesterase CpdA